jgi:hypothetical protein
MITINQNQAIQPIPRKSEELQVLTDFEKRIILAAQDPRIWQLKEEEVGMALTQYISRAFITMGLRPLTKEDRIVLQKLIIDDLYISFKNITLKEVEIAIYKGSMGDFKKRDDDTYFNLVPKDVHSWIKSYIELFKKEAIAKQRQIEAKENKKKKLSIDEQNKIINGLITECIIQPYNEFRKTGIYNISDPVNFIYNTLDRFNLIPFNVAEKKQIQNQAIAEIRKEKSGVGNLEVMKANKEYLIKIDQPESLVQTDIKMRCKQIALKRYFEECRDQNFDLENEIKNLMVQ